jgi:hypothetical protein
VKADPMRGNSSVSSYRGLVTLIPTAHWLGLSRLEVSEKSCVLQSVLGREWYMDRAEVLEIEFRKVRLVFVNQTLVAFLGRTGRRLAPYFVPSRAGPVRAGLHKYGWPTTDVGLGTWVKRLLTKSRSGHDGRLSKS